MKASIFIREPHRLQTNGLPLFALGGMNRHMIPRGPLPPLEIRLDELGKLLGKLANGICIVMFFIALIQGGNLSEIEDAVESHRCSRRRALRHRARVSSSTMPESGLFEAPSRREGARWRRMWGASRLRRSFAREVLEEP